MSVTRFEVEQALNLAESLRDKGFSVIIAGGFARDVYFGVAPKDIDIVVAAGSIHDDPSEAHMMLDEILTDLGVVHLGFRMYSESACERLVGGFKCLGNVDVVLYDTKLALEAVDAFDFNLNQFVLTGRTLGTAYVTFEGKPHWSELVAVRKDFTEARMGKMQEKFLDLTWRWNTEGAPAEVPLSAGNF